MVVLYHFGVGKCSTSKPPVRLDFGSAPKKNHINYIHPGKLTWNLKMNPWKKEIPIRNHHFQVLVSPTKNNNQNPGFLSFPPTIQPRILKTRRDTTRGRRRQGSNERPFTRSSPSIWNTREVNCLSDVLDVKGGGCPHLQGGAPNPVVKGGLWLL